MLHTSTCAQVSGTRCSAMSWWKRVQKKGANARAEEEEEEGKEEEEEEEEEEAAAAAAAAAVVVERKQQGGEVGRMMQILAEASLGCVR